MDHKSDKRLALLNRQPTLFRHGIPGIEIIPSDDIDDNFTIGLSPLILEPINGDFDGDTCAIYELHDTKSIQEIKEKAFLKNYVKYDQNDNHLATIRHEILFSAYLLTEKIVIDSDNENYIEIEELSDLPEDIDHYNKLNLPVKFQNKFYSYGLCLFNKWCKFKFIKIDYTIFKKNNDLLSEIIYKDCKFNTGEYYNRLVDLSKKLVFLITLIKVSPSINIDELVDLLDENSESLFKKIPHNNIPLGFSLNMALTDRCYNNFNKDSILYKLYKSGSRFSKEQLSRISINIGYCANAQNIVDTKLIRNNLLKGLNEDQFFRSSIGARKGISDKDKATPDSGYLERTLTMGLSPVEIIEEDCNDPKGMDIFVLNDAHAKTLINKYYKDPNDRYTDWTILDYQTAKKFVNKKIYIRSPITCQTPNFRICQKCFGKKKSNTKTVGIVAGQVVAERLTQLTMRTFHLSGMASLDYSQNLVDFIKTHLVDIENIDENKTKLIFDTNDIIEEFKTIKGYTHTSENTVVFDKYIKKVENKDSIKTLKDINKLLLTEKNKKDILHPKDYYLKLMGYLLQVGTIYSSYIEIVFANMFIVSKDTETTFKKFWRYNQAESIIQKYGKTQLSKELSPLLGLLYTPNKKTIDKINNYDTNMKNPTVYEKLWLNIL